MSRLKKLAIAIGVVLVLGFSGLVCQRVGERGRFSVPYSSYGSGPKGARAVFLLSQRLGVQPVRWTEDLVRLPAGGMLVALGGCDLVGGRRLGDFERERVNEWVEGGGTLVVAGASQLLGPDDGVWLHRPPGHCDPERGLLGAIARATRDAGPRDAGPPEGDALRKLENPDGGAPPSGDRDALRKLENSYDADAGARGLGADDPWRDPDRPTYGPPDAGAPTFGELGEQFADDPGGTIDELGETDPEPAPIPAAPAAGPLADMGDVTLRKPADVRIADDARERTETLLEVGGEPAAVALERGEGRIVAVADASLLQNERLEGSRGGVLFARLMDAYAPGETVYFDEYHLGLGSRRSLVKYVRQLGGGPLALQLLLVLALVVWRFGSRFGTPRQQAAPKPGGTASYVTAVGELYRRAAEPEGATAILVRRALSRVAEHHHLQPGDAESLASQLDDRDRKDEARAVRRLGTLAREPVGKRGALVTRAREIDDALAAAIPDEGIGHRRGPHPPEIERGT